MHDRFALPPDLPVPRDDGAADHLSGTAFPTIALTATDGLKRPAMLTDDGVVTTDFYPVFPRDRNASDALAWLHANPRGSR